MKTIRKVISLGLLTLIACLTFGATETKAANGPSTGPSADSFIGVMNTDEEVFYPFLGHEDMNEYLDPKPVLESMKGVSYDLKTNTLTLNNFTGLQISVSEMGDDFTIKLKGDNSLSTLMVNGYFHGGSLTFTGNGKMEVNRLDIEGENTDASITVKGKAVVELCNPVFTSLFPTLAINETRKAKNVINANCNVALNRTKSTAYKNRTIFLDGEMTWATAVTKDGKEYYSKSVMKDDTEVSRENISYINVFETDGVNLTKIRQIDSLEAFEAEYEYVYDTVYNYSYDGNDLVILTAKKKASGKDMKKGDGFTVTGMNFTVKKAATGKKAGTVELSSVSDTFKGSLYIPESVKYDGKKYTVSSVAAGICNGNTEIESILIPDSIKKIGKKAFADCTGLIEFIINVKDPASITIGKNAMSGMNDECHGYINCTDVEAMKEKLISSGLSESVSVVSAQELLDLFEKIQQ